MADLIINQTPISVSMECDECMGEINMTYDEFTEKYGNACQWTGEIIKCPHCGHENEIEEWEFA